MIALRQTPKGESSRESGAVEHLRRGQNDAAITEIGNDDLREGFRFIERRIGIDE